MTSKPPYPMLFLTLAGVLSLAAVSVACVRLARSGGVAPAPSPSTAFGGAVLRRQCIRTIANIVEGESGPPSARITHVFSDGGDISFFAGAEDVYAMSDLLLRVSAALVRGGVPAKQDGSSKDVAS
jgi:hypothetical protein